MRRLRSIIYVLVAAVLGAVVGRLAFQARERMDAGQSATSVNLGAAQPRVQDVIPGLVAAFRVQDTPWSWFHIPAWLAALAVNAAVGTVGGDFTSLRERAERIVFEFAGLDARDFGMGGDDHGEGEPDGYGSSTTWSAPPPPPPSSGSSTGL